MRHDLCVRHRERHLAGPPSSRHRDNAVILDIKTKELAPVAQTPQDSQGSSVISPETKVAPSIPQTSSVGTSDAEYGTTSRLSPEGTDSTPPSCSVTAYGGLYARHHAADSSANLGYQHLPIAPKQPEFMPRNPSFSEVVPSGTGNPRIYTYNLPVNHQNHPFNPPVTAAAAASIAQSFETPTHVSTVETAPIAALNPPQPENTNPFLNNSSAPSTALTDTTMAHTQGLYVQSQQCQLATEIPFPYPEADAQNKPQHCMPIILDARLPGSSVTYANGNNHWPTMDLTSCPISLFGGDCEPGQISDGSDVYRWLFNGNSSPASPYDHSAVATNQYTKPYAQIPPEMFPQDYTLRGPLNNIVPQHMMTVSNMLQGSRHTTISDSKRQQMIDYIRIQFVAETGDGSGEPERRQSQIDEIFQGDINSDDHVLSLRMMQHYIASYWQYSDAEVPILHKPTFVPDQTCVPLLLSIMVMGAATLNGQWGQDMLNRTSKLATFIATHLRWKIFTHPHAQAPAKLWVFQALVLLELYEKMYSTRSLHERAHIHHDGLLTLMRRGSSLVTRFPDSPTMRNDDNQEPAENGATTATDDGPMAAERLWARFIETESTRRVAFAAFAMDSLHATMFGHLVKMVVHGLKLPLPCHEALWQAPSAMEAAQVQYELSCLGPEITQPTMFLDALKKALNGSKVQTTSFGQVIIMSGLLSVNWNLSQRDIQAHSLGISGSRDEWRKTLLRAFDHWVEEYDEAMRDSGRSPLLAADYPRNSDLTFGSRNVLHHMAHMASHVDAIDCQRFAGAGCLMNRHTTLSKYQATVRRMLEWARKPSARDATYHALKLLCEVYIAVDGESEGTSLPRLTRYCARDDNLFHRPWAIYLATLIVWAYGFALEGPLGNSIYYAKNNGTSPMLYPTPDIQTAEGQEQDMFAYLMCVGSIKDPSELEMTPGRNQCLGLLFVVRESLSNTRWELLTEAVNLLGSCINKLLNYKPPEAPQSQSVAAADPVAAPASDLRWY